MPLLPWRNGMNNLRLTDYQIAEVFQPVLSGIYKAKVRELNEDLVEVYAHLDSLDIPRYTDFHRWFARQCLPDWAKAHLKTIDHINRIRRIKVNETTMGKELDIESARNVPIETLYPFKFKGKNVSCPFHGSDASPSMSLKNNKFNCFTCGAKGSSIDFMMKLNNIGFREAVRILTT